MGSYFGRRHSQPLLLETIKYIREYCDEERFEIVFHINIFRFVILEDFMENNLTQ